MSSPFVWDVDRVIFEIPLPGDASFPIRWYSLLFMGGLILGYHIVKWMVEREGRDPIILESGITYVVLGTLIGARLGHVLFYEPARYLSQPLEIFKVWEGGLASHGGFLGVIISLILFARNHRDKVSFFWLADRVAVASMFGAACIRLGNFFNSEIVGEPTSVPWAVVFKRHDLIPRHPTQLYEAIGYFWIGLFSLWLYKQWGQKTLEGRLLGIVMVMGFGYRLLLEMLKENQVGFEQQLPLNMGQLLSIPFILFGLYFATGAHHSSRFFRRGVSQ